MTTTYAIMLASNKVRETKKTRMNSMRLALTAFDVQSCYHLVSDLVTVSAAFAWLCKVQQSYVMVMYLDPVN